ncbi:MAG: RHS repeat-associated core domain-containing protein [Terriglobales bacterium]
MGQLNGWSVAQTAGALSINTFYAGSCGYYDYNMGDYDNSISIYDTEWSFLDPKGTNHALPGDWTTLSDDSDVPDTNCPNPSSSGFTQQLYDGSGYTFTVDSTGNYPAVYDAVGNYYWPGGMLDRNGNEITLGGSGDELDYFDTLSGSTPALEVIQPNASTVYFKYNGSSGSLVTITESLASTPLRSYFNCSGSADYNSGTVYLPSALTREDGASFSFSYTSSDQISGLTLPTGGAIAWGHAFDCSDGGDAELERWESVDGLASGDPHWDWTRTHSGGNIITTETSPPGDKAIITSRAGLPGEVDSYSGASALLQTQAVAYSSDSNGEVTQRTTTTIVPAGSGTINAQQVESYNSLAQTDEVDDYDWNAGSINRGTRLRKVVTAFQMLDSADQTVSVPASVKTYDASDNVAGESDYAYDGAAPQATTGTPQQMAAPWTARGNLTSVHAYTSASGYLSQAFTYYDTGALHSASGANAAVTTYLLNADAGCKNSFVAEVDAPVSGLSTKAGWNCSGGVLLSTTDANGQATSIGYNDPAGTWRPTSTTAADGQVSYYGYSTNTSEQSTTFNGGASTVDILTSLDGLGRPSLVQRRQAPGVDQWDTVSTSYDAMGRPASVSLPFASTGGSGWGSHFTTTTYDALSRPVKIVDGGGGEADISYPLDDVLTTVQGGGSAPTVSRQEEMDGLGRLVSVCELTVGTSAWPAGACNQRSAASGYLTAYTRDTLGDITAVSQDSQAGSGGVESRSFAFDELGRLTSEWNPESKWTYYAFDGDSACGTGASDSGSLVKRVDNAGNVTCYLHDALGRVTTLLYPSGPNHGYTSTKHFQYDAATLANGAVMRNVAGKLAEAWTGDARTTDLGFSYPNPGGDEKQVYQSSSDSGGWYMSSAQHYPNGVASNLVVPGLAAVVTYGLDGEGRPNLVDGATTLVGAASYSADGLASITFGSGDSDAYSYDPATGRMAQYSFTVNGTSNIGALAWNANGTLASLGLTQNIYPSGPSGTCSYSHDDLGRVASVSCPGIWGQTFSFDPFGNLAKTGNDGGTSFSASFNLSNQIGSVGGYSGAYDPNGNLLNDPSQSMSTVNAFDTENRAVTFEGVNVLYDALGRAVEADGHEIVYGPDGGKLAVMSGTSLYRADIPLPGGAEAVYMAGGLTAFRHADQLGSAPLASTQARTVWSAVGYAPYGEPFSSTGSDRSFTGQKQDIAPSQGGGQYDFLMREYSPVQGRWWTPDPAALAAVDPNNPQTWNRYAYVGGRPLGFTDPLGLQPCRNASLHQAGHDSNANGEFGPLDSSSDDSDIAAGDGCVDGVWMDSYLMGEMIGVGGGWGGGGSLSADVCPSGCNTAAWVDEDPDDPSIGGHWRSVQYEPLDGGGAGYYSPDDLTSGVHDIGDSVYTDANYVQQSKYLSYQTCVSLSAGLKFGTANCTDIRPLEGGHYNYGFTCNGGGDCSGRYADGVHIKKLGIPTSPYFVIHFDGASPYLGASFTWGALNPFDLVAHVLGDVVYGSLCNCILPH